MKLTGKTLYVIDCAALLLGIISLYGIVMMVLFLAIANKPKAIGKMWENKTTLLIICLFFLCAIWCFVRRKRFKFQLK